MGRLIFIVLTVALVVWLLRRASEEPRADGPAAAGGEAKGDLVSCAHCGVNLPITEARSAGGRHYCGEEHWRLGPRDG
jgi:uncharacterized protein